MGLIFRLSLRNLLKQKRRSLFLGIGIGFGMMILVIANSFSHGLVDVLINDVVSYAFGHIVVQGQGNGFYSMISDKARIEKIINETIKEEDLFYIEESLGMMGRAIGNGEADNLVVVGVSVDDEEEREEFFNGFFTLVEGNFDDYFSEKIKYPVIISEEKAKSLKVGLLDTIKIRIPMVTGQIEAANLTVIAIANANNSFMDIVTFMDGKRVKELLGYKPWESASLQITLKDPVGNAKYYADLLHDKLQPGKIAFQGQIQDKKVQIFAYVNNNYTINLLKEHISITAGNEEEAFAKDGVMISSVLAESLNLKAGDKITYQYNTKYRGIYEDTLTIDAVYKSDNELNHSTILFNEEKIHETYHKYLPAGMINIKDDSSIYKMLTTEWKLLERSKDSNSLMKKYQDEKKIKTDQVKYDVITMYEGASQILKLEGVLNMVTIIAVLVLFFILLIGVINTLRMTIKERTREIGTIRAIGMQKRDVKNMFIIETLLLTVISCIVGIFAGVLLMKVLGLIAFDINNALSMILKDNRLNFKFNFKEVLIYFIFILFISGMTAYFPAKKAAKMSTVDALRHFE